MCFRCYQNDSAPSDAEREIAKMVLALPVDANGAAVIDSLGRTGHATVVRTVIRTAKRSGVVINSERCSQADAYRVVRAVAEGRMAA